MYQNVDCRALWCRFIDKITFLIVMVTPIMSCWRQWRWSCGTM